MQDFTDSTLFLPTVLSAVRSYCPTWSWACVLCTKVLVLVIQRRVHLLPLLLRPLQPRPPTEFNIENRFIAAGRRCHNFEFIKSALSCPTQIVIPFKIEFKALVSLFKLLNQMDNLWHFPLFAQNCKILSFQSNSSFRTFLSLFRFRWYCHFAICLANPQKLATKNLDSTHLAHRSSLSAQGTVILKENAKYRRKSLRCHSERLSPTCLGIVKSTRCIMHQFRERWTTLLRSGAAR